MVNYCLVVVVGFLKFHFLCVCLFDGVNISTYIIQSVFYFIIISIILIEPLETLDLYSYLTKIKIIKIAEKELPAPVKKAFLRFFLIRINSFLLLINCSSSIFIVEFDISRKFLCFNIIESFNNMIESFNGALIKQSRHLIS